MVEDCGVKVAMGERGRARGWNFSGQNGAKWDETGLIKGPKAIKFWIIKSKLSKHNQLILHFYKIH